MTRKVTPNTNLDPFARLADVSEAPVADIGEASNTTDNFEEEREVIKQFIPDAATTEAGVAKVMQMFANNENSQASGVHPQQTIFDTNPNPTSMVTPPNSGSGEVPRSPNTSPAPEPTTETKELDIKDEDILPMLDSLLTTGYVKEKYSIRNATFVLRSQFFWEDKMVVDMLNDIVTEDTLRATGNFYFQIYALAANLESFGGNYFKPLRQAEPALLRKSLQTRIDFLLTLPSIMITYLFQKRSEFIQKLNYLTENFDRLVKAF